MALFGCTAAMLSLTGFARPGLDQLGDLPPLPPPLCRTEAWVETHKHLALELGTALANHDSNEGIAKAQEALAAEGWDAVPSLVEAWRELDLATPEGASSGAALAGWFNQLALGTTVRWVAEDPAANRDEVASLYGSYLDARRRNWPKLGDESNSTFLKARVWADDLLRTGASRTEVRDARKGIGEAEWDAVPAVLEGIQELDLGDPNVARKIKTVIRLMERFPGAPDGAWSEGGEIEDRLANLALLEDYMTASLVHALRRIPARSKSALVPKRDWVQWERRVDEFLESPESAPPHDDIVAIGAQVRGVLQNAFRNLDLLDGKDYTSGLRLDGVLRELDPESSTPPWLGSGDAHPARAARTAVFAWCGGDPTASASSSGGSGGAGGKFGGRFGGRKRLTSRGGRAIAEAIGGGLAWLAANQLEDGSWSAAPWAEVDGEPIPGHEVGLTALVLLAFTGDGQFDDRSLYSESAAKGVRWLLTQQDPQTGAFGTPRSHDWIYDHAIATLAVAEFAYMTGEAAFLESTTLAVQYLESQREPKGAWRYGKRMGGGEDTSVTAWVVTALRSAQEAGVEVNQESLDFSLAWFEKVTNPETGRAGYADPGSFSARVMGINDDFPSDGSEAMSAAALWGTLLTMEEPEVTPRLEGYSKLLAAALPVWEEKRIDFYYWYWGTLSAWQMGGRSPWESWENAMRAALLPNQRQDGEFKGSWDPKGAWCHVGRRVYSTAMGTLTLETYYRFGKFIR